MKMFGVLDLETQMECCRFAVGVRNSHDKSLRLGPMLRPEIRGLEYGVLRGFHTWNNVAKSDLFGTKHYSKEAQTAKSVRPVRRATIFCTNLAKQESSTVSKSFIGAAMRLQLNQDPSLGCSGFRGR